MPPRSHSALAEQSGGLGRLPSPIWSEGDWVCSPNPWGNGAGGAAGMCWARAEDQDEVTRWLLRRGAAVQRGWAGDCSLLYISKVY